MSENNLILVEHITKSPKNLSNIKISKSINSLKLKTINSKHSIVYINTPNQTDHININISSLKRIFTLNLLDYKEYITISLDKEDSNINSEEHSLSESLTISKINEETTDDGEESTIKEDDFLNEEKNKKELHTPSKKRNDNNIFEPNSPLLHNKIVNTFSSLDKVPQKYLSLIICGNKAVINLDYLKCIYPSIFCCGVLNLIYFVNIIFTINLHLNLSFHYFLYIPLALLLIITGVYGYKKVKKNLYNDEFCIVLTNISSIAPIFSFVLSLIYKEKIAKNQLVSNFLINLFSCFFSFSCIIILKEAERIKNCEKDIIIQN